MAGLGLDEFLNHDADTGRRKYVKKWQEEGELVWWMNTRAMFAYSRYVHTFPSFDTGKDDKGNEYEYLKFGRYVSPDVDLINRDQFFRDEDTDLLRTPPVKDPFLLLREWLRSNDCGLGLDDVVFRWENPNPKKREIIEWTRGEMTRLTERGQSNWNHSLDSKLEYMFVGTLHDEPGEGNQIITGTKVLGDALRKMIEEQRDSKGRDEGNPLITPYAIKFKYDKRSKNPMKAYSVAPYERAELTPEIRESIMSSDFPNPEIDTQPRKGDKERLRAAMYDAAQVELPWDEIFVDAWEDDPSFDPSEFGERRKTPTSASSSAQTRADNTAQTRQRAPSGAVSKPSTGGGPKTRTAPSTAPSTANGAPAKQVEQEQTQRRRRKEPEVPQEPCEGCKVPFPVTATKCPNCGMEYEVTEDDEEPAAPAHNGVVASAGTPTGIECWSCGGEVRNGRCGACGIDASDDIPL
jgi:hypothetical protein